VILTGTPQGSAWRASRRLAQGGNVTIDIEKIATHESRSGRKMSADRNVLHDRFGCSSLGLYALPARMSG